MTLQSLPLLHVLEAELAHVELLAVRKLLGIGREVPGVDLELANLNCLDVLHLGDLLMLFLERRELRILLQFEICANVRIGSNPGVRLIGSGHLVVSNFVSLALSLPCLDPFVSFGLLFFLLLLVRAELILGDPLIEPPVEFDVMDVVIPCPLLRAGPALKDFAGVQLAVLLPSARYLRSYL